MTKKPIFWIIVALVIALVAVVVLWSKQYYEDRYVGSDYYTMVPIDFDVTPETIYSMNGEDLGLGKNYKLTAYNEQGEAKTVEFTVLAENGTFPRPGAFLHVSASRQIVIRWNVIAESDIPEKVSNMIRSTR
ncbi:MAG: YxeA family protein [Treponema sp.]|jgi:uncharacterized protein (TIGR01655 family)|nr:YxeA family protein [Treponema sp.]